MMYNGTTFSKKKKKKNLEFLKLAWKWWESISHPGGYKENKTRSTWRRISQQTMIRRLYEVDSQKTKNKKRERERERLYEVYMNNIIPST